MYSPNSFFSLRHVNCVRPCVNLWRTTGEGLFLRNLHRRTEKNRKHIGLRVKDNVILSTFHSLRVLRAAPRKYQLDLEIAKKSNFSKLAQNEALRALVTKMLF